MTNLITIRRLRFGSGLVLMFYIAGHLANHALGLVSLDVAEKALATGIAIWQSQPGTMLLYGAAVIHVALALRAIYQRRTLRLPMMELLRIGLGLWLPVLLIGHAVSARLEHEIFGTASSYTRIVSAIWANGSEWRQIGLLAPGWLHGVLGLNFALSHRGWFRRARLALFAVALLLPVLSALGFIAMGREIARQQAADGVPAKASAAQSARVAVLNQWRDGLLFGYFGIIGFAFAARGARNLVERGRKRLIAVTYPSKTVRVPRGWSVLDASRAFHIPHASMCAGAARCSTCRVRVLSGQDHLSPADTDERATLSRIGAAHDVRLACRLRPQSDISVVPLVNTDRPLYGQVQRRIDGDTIIVLLFADVTNRDALARDHLAQDLLFVLTRHCDAVVAAVRGTGGAISHVGHDGVCAVFGIETSIGKAARAACEAAAIIDRSLRDFDTQLGSQWDCRATVTISLHLGAATLAEVGRPDAPDILVVGDVYDEAQPLRQAARTSGVRFAISEQVLREAGAVSTCDVMTLETLRACLTNDPAILGIAQLVSPPPVWTRALSRVRT